MNFFLALAHPRCPARRFVKWVVVVCCWSVEVCHLGVLCSYFDYVVVYRSSALWVIWYLSPVWWWHFGSAGQLLVLLKLNILNDEYSNSLILPFYGSNFRQNPYIFPGGVPLSVGTTAIHLANHNYHFKTTELTRDEESEWASGRCRSRHCAWRPTQPTCPIHPATDRTPTAGTRHSDACSPRGPTSPPTSYNDGCRAFKVKTIL